ncbi:DNA repair protein RadC [Haloferula luteola]|uniref:DNA repair protein RadC n=1 Tax=Haloferula luteola TaxID=595692 RepID=A0A840VBD6_9BACT|nr:DNA repair protein RadC [Haloferula luteola]MBB5350201.1 DNA repair protein RadC [Haloferula luteola]
MNLIRHLPSDERPREKLARLGPSALDNSELIALFLRTGIKGKSAIEVGRDILRHFGSLHGLGAAGLSGLQNCPGLGLAKASQLAAAFELGARLARERMNQRPLDSPERIHEAFAPQLAHLPQEKLLLAMVNTRLEHLGTVEVSSGTLTETAAHPRDIFRPCLLHHAWGFILIHNHPSGDPRPSAADTEFTHRLHDAAEILNIRFLDHIIIGRATDHRDPFFSYREMGMIHRRSA